MAFYLKTETAIPKTHGRRFSCRPENAYRGLRVENLGRRFYSPTLGRWAKRDPIGERGGLDLYQFVRNNAFSWNDPVGLASGEEAAENKPFWLKDCPCHQKDVDATAYRASQKAKTSTARDPQTREFCGLLCCNLKTAKVRATLPHGGPPPEITEINQRGERRVVKAHCRPHEAFDLRDNTYYDRRTVNCDPGEKEVAWYHSHPEASQSSFSGWEGDWGYIVGASREPGYLVTPDGKVQRLDPIEGWTIEKPIPAMPTPVTILSPDPAPRK